jgi:hypothetical protein
MFDDLQDVPPAVPLLINEALRTKDMSEDDIRAGVRRLLPELKRQSAWYLEQPKETRIAQPVGKLDTYLDGGLNLFDLEASCAALKCRMQTAYRVSRSVALLADTVWLTDCLSPRLAKLEKATESQVMDIADDGLILTIIAPLIDAKILRFTSPVKYVCPVCNSTLDDEIDHVTDHVMEMFESEFNVVHEKGLHYLSSGSLFYPSMSLFSKTPRREPSPALMVNSAWDLVREATRKAIGVSFHAGTGGGAVFSNSKAAMAALAYREGNASTVSQLRTFEDNRNINIPWVNNLSPLQIVQLRQEAAKSLPLFRESLATALESSEGGASAVKETVASLRAQAVEVRGEIDNTKQHAARFWKTSYMTLGFGVSAYGIGTGQVLPALGGLLPLLQLMVAHKTGTEKDLDKLQRRPGYLLVKAQDILDHAH